MLWSLDARLALISILNSSLIRISSCIRPATDTRIFKVVMGQEAMRQGMMRMATRELTLTTRCQLAVAMGSRLCQCPPGIALKLSSGVGRWKRRLKGSLKDRSRFRSFLFRGLLCSRCLWLKTHRILRLWVSFTRVWTSSSSSNNSLRTSSSRHSRRASSMRAWIIQTCSNSAQRARTRSSRSLWCTCRRIRATGTLPKVSLLNSQIISATRHRETRDSLRLSRLLISTRKRSRLWRSPKPSFRCRRRPCLKYSCRHRKDWGLHRSWIRFRRVSQF